MVGGVTYILFTAWLTAQQVNQTFIVAIKAMFYFIRFFSGEASKFVSNIYALANLTPGTAIYIYNTVCIYSVTSCNVITTDTLIEKYLLRWHQGKNGYFLKNWEIKKCQFSTLKSICFNMHLKKSLKKFQFGFKLHFFWTVIWFLHLSNDLSNALSQITLKRKRPSASNFRSESPAGFVYNKQVGFKL